MSDQEIIEKIKNGDNKISRNQYEIYKESFQYFIYKYYGLDNETTNDLYQETWIAVYENLIDGKLLELTASLKTYLFQVGRNQARILFKKREKLITKIKNKKFEEIENIKDEEILSYENDDDVIGIKKQSIVKDVVNKMTEVCRKILGMFFYQNKKLDEMLMLLSDYSSKNALKTKKYKCIKSLENDLRNKFLSEGII